MAINMYSYASYLVSTINQQDAKCVYNRPTSKIVEENDVRVNAR